MTAACAIGSIRRPFVAFPLAATALLLANNVSGDTRCTSIGQQTDATVIAYEPPTAFTICRAGHVDEDVVVGRPVYVELVPRPGEGLYNYRVHGRATRIDPTGLRAAAERIDGLHAGLHALTSSTQTIAEASSAAAAPSVGAVERNRVLYLGVATPRFHEALTAIGKQLEDLPIVAKVLSSWCGELGAVSDAPDARRSGSDVAIRARPRQASPRRSVP